MVRVLFVSLCFCCAILCACVAFWSYNLDDGTAETEPVQPTTVSCEDLLTKKPEAMSHLLMTECKPGSRYATRDWDEDGKWELVCVPYFPKSLGRNENNYCAAIVFFHQVADLDELNEFDVDAVEAQFFPGRQTLDDDVYASLAGKYDSLDFSGCVILHSGFIPPAPIGGEFLLKGSMGLGFLFIIIGCWSALALMFSSRKNDIADEADETPVINRAGLPNLGSQASDIESN